MRRFFVMVDTSEGRNSWSLSCVAACTSWDAMRAALRLMFNVTGPLLPPHVYVRVEENHQYEWEWRP